MLFLLLFVSIPINALWHDTPPEVNLINAARCGDTQEVTRLLQHGVDVNFQDGYDLTALIEASSNGHAEVVRILLQQSSIDVNAINLSDKTALMQASSSGHTQVVKLLLQYPNIDVNAQDDDNYTALIYASLEGWVRVVKVLLEHGADVHIATQAGRTALMWTTNRAYLKRCAGTVESLLKHGANVHAKDDDGESALDMAAKQEVAALLVLRGANPEKIHNYHGQAFKQHAFTLQRHQAIHTFLYSQYISLPNDLAENVMAAHRLLMLIEK